MKPRSTGRKKKAEYPKVVIDSNVFISAVVFGGKPREVLNLGIEGEIRLAVSIEILDEIRAVLRGKKFQYPTRVLYSIEKEIVAISEIVDPHEEIQAIPEDPGDNRVLECAVESGSDYIITGDHHLLELSHFQDIRIVSPDDFLREYRKK